MDAQKVSTFASAFEKEEIALRKNECVRGRKNNLDFFEIFLAGIKCLLYLCNRFPRFWRQALIYDRMMDRGQAASGDFVPLGCCYPEV